MRPTLHTERIIFNADPELKADVDSYACERKITRAQAIRILLRQALTK